MIRTLAIAATAGFVSFAAPEPALAQKDTVYTGIFGNTAVDGYDAVSFFNGEPVKGSSEYETTYNGATWQFSSAENLARFKEDPASFAPQYGGYCAWAVAQGYTAKGDPEYATVVAGKLYLNFNEDVQSKWQRDIPGFIRQADANWPGVLDR